jgi:hypothetical protein
MTSVGAQQSGGTYGMVLCVEAAMSRHITPERSRVHARIPAGGSRKASTPGNRRGVTSLAAVTSRSGATSLYFPEPSTIEQWVEADFHVPESFTQVSLQMTDRARCLPLMSAS